MHPEPRSTGTSLARRGVAVVVLAVAAWLVLKIVIGVLTSIATVAAVVLAIVAVVWALRSF